MLPRRNSNRICLGSDRYRYIVAETVDSDEDVVALTVTVQSENANGSLLRVIGLTTTRVPAMESKFYMGRTVTHSIRPQHVANLTSRVQEIGWCPRESGSPFVLEVANSDVFGFDS